MPSFFLALFYAGVRRFAAYTGYPSWAILLALAVSFCLVIAIIAAVVGPGAPG
jgi:hypothetical protein